MKPLPLLGAQPARHDPAALSREILAQPRFRTLVARPAARTWWDAVREWIGLRWHQLLDAFSRNVHLGGRWSIALGDVVIALAVLLVAAVALRLLLGMARDADAAGTVRAQALAQHAGAAELEAAATAEAARGAYERAIALLFRAALAVLDARGVLRDDPSRTVNECRSDVRSRARALGASFDRLARAFTAAVYADRRITSEDWMDARDAYDAFGMTRNDAA